MGIPFSLTSMFTPENGNLDYLGTFIYIILSNIYKAYTISTESVKLTISVKTGIIEE